MPLILGPRVDGDFLPEEPAHLVKIGRHQRVPLMSGITADEGAFITMRESLALKLLVDLKLQ